jgi:hypothetical protein
MLLSAIPVVVCLPSSLRCSRPGEVVESTQLYAIVWYDGCLEISLVNLMDEVGLDFLRPSFLLDDCQTARYFIMTFPSGDARSDE